MIKPIFLMTDDDKKVFFDYVLAATGKHPDVDAALETWCKAKDSLFESVFDRKSLKRTIHVDLSFSNDNLDHMSRAISNVALPLVSDVSEYILDLEYKSLCMPGTLRRIMSLFDPKSIVKGAVPQNVYLKSYLDKSMTIPYGMKPMRAIRKALEYFDYGKMEMFESFRDSVSLLLTDKRIDRDIVLSIDPIDFLSMSDNSCGWNTCMSWLTKDGTYSGSVMEMLNSPHALVAYTVSSEHGEFRDGVPNKSWRQLVYASDHFVVGGRQYPYVSATMSSEIVKFLSDKMSLNDGVCRRYPNKDEYRIYSSLDNSDIKDNTRNCIDLLNEMHPKDCYLFYTNGACNDFSMFPDDVYFATTLPINTCFSANLSGPATCAVCGKPIDRDLYHRGDRVGTSKKICLACEQRVEDNRL